MFSENSKKFFFYTRMTQDHLLRYDVFFSRSEIGYDYAH